MIPGKEMLRTDEAAAVLRVSRSTMYRMIDMGDIPATKPKNRRGWLIKANDIQKYLDDNKSEAAEI